MRNLLLLAALLLLSVAARADVLTLTWQDNSDNEDGFIIERCDGPTPTLFVEIARYPENSTSYRDNVTDFAQVRLYRVTAFRNDGARSAPSNVAVWSPGGSATPTPTATPAPPTPTPQVAIRAPSAAAVTRQP